MSHRITRLREPARVEELEGRALLASQPLLVRDINPGSGGAYPQELVEVDGTLFFAANDGRHGRELWKSDGTASGTERVADIFPGRTGSDPTELTNVDGILFFVADDGEHGREIWKSDGTLAGTALFSNMAPEDPLLRSALSRLTNVNGSLFFHQRVDLKDVGHSHGYLWRTNGTKGDPVFVAETGRDALADAPWWMVSVGETLFFTSAEHELWRSDGTANGMTKIVTDAEFITGLTAAGDRVFFFSGVVDDPDGGTWFYPQLWTSDGTSAGTRLVKEAWFDGIWGPSDPTTGNPSIFLSILDGSNIPALWTSDGTASGMVRIPASDLYPRSLTDVGGTAYFVGEHWPPDAVPSIWKSDGSTAGTTELVWLAEGIGVSSDPSAEDLTVVGDTLYFSVDDDGGAHGRELWMLPLPFASLTDNGSLRVQGTDANDTISLTVRGSTLQVWRDGRTLSYNLADVRQVEIDASGGDDVIDFSGISIPTYCLGGFGNDYITAGLGSDTLSGSAGKDTLFGGGGDDYLSGGGTNDQLYGESGDDHLTGGDANDVLYGGPHDDRLYGDGGNDTLLAGAGKDIMYGGDGDDELTGGTGWDLHAGQAGNDRLLARDGRDDAIEGGDGDDFAERDELLDIVLGVEVIA